MMRPEHAGTRSVRAAVAAGAMALLLSACGWLQPEIVRTLPVKAADITFDWEIVVDDSFGAGHVVDDVLAALGRQRSQATAVFRSQLTGPSGVGLFMVSGVSGDELLDAVVRTWESAAVVSRTQTTLGDRDAWVLEMRRGDVTIVYRRGDAVYFGFGDDRTLVERLVIEGLP